MTRQQKLDAIADSLLQYDWEQYVLFPDYEQGNQVGQLAQEILEILDRLEPQGVRLCPGCPMTGRDGTHDFWCPDAYPGRYQ